MPLSKIQIEVLRIIAQCRDPQNYIAGATPLNREMPRFSNVIDVFSDREEHVEAAAETDAAALRLDDYQEHHGHRGGQWPSDPEIMRAMLERYNDGAK